MRATSGVMAAALLAALGGIPARAGNADYVDPFIGTAAGTQPYAKATPSPAPWCPTAWSPSARTPARATPAATAPGRLH